MVKSAPALSGMRNIRTMSGSRKGSIPHRSESIYLRLYMLQTENDRLDQEFTSVKKRRLTLKRRMDEIRKEIDRLERQKGMGLSPGALTTPRHTARAGPKPMPIRY